MVCGARNSGNCLTAHADPLMLAFMSSTNECLLTYLLSAINYFFLTDFLSKAVVRPSLRLLHVHSSTKTVRFRSIISIEYWL